MSIKFRHPVKALMLSLLISTVGPIGVASTDLDETISGSGLAGSFLASRVAINENDDDAAVLFLERALSLDPENNKLHQDLFVSLVTNGRVDDAAEMVGDIQADGQAGNLALMVDAITALRKRSWNKSFSTLELLEGGDLDMMLREIISSWALFGDKKSTEALDRLEAIDGPEWIMVIRDHHAGLLATAAGELAIAEEKFKSVIANRVMISVLTETYIRSVEALIRNELKAGDFEGATKQLKFGQSLIPSHPPFKILADAIAKETVPPPLIASPQQGAAELFFNVATGIKRDGGTALAKTYLQLAKYLAADSDVISIALAELYLQQGSYESSNIYYESVKEASSFHHIAQLERASNLARMDKKQEAIEVLLEILDENPTDLLGYMTLGELYSREKQYKEAAEIYNRAVEQIGTEQNHHWRLFYRRGIAYERLNKWDLAEPNFTKALELSANQPDVLNYLGYSWIDQGINLDEGMDLIRKAVDLRPRSGFIVDSLGWAHYRLGKYEDAVRELERAAELMPQDPTINDHLGDAYWRVGRKLEATFQWKIALSGEPPIENKEMVEKKLREGLTDNPQTTMEN